MKKVYKDAELPVFEIVCSENMNDPTGIRLLSLVDEPAIEQKCLMFSKEDLKDYSFKADATKQMLVGPMMIANMKILRKDEDGNKYFVLFKPETIELMVNKFMKGDNNHSINVDHSEVMVNAYISQIWIVQDTYQSGYGFKLPVGSAMCCVKIEDSQFWNQQVKGEGKFGFSIEGLMDQKPFHMAEIKAGDSEVKSPTSTEEDEFDELVWEIMNELNK
jgi:hypothetical protein